MIVSKMVGHVPIGVLDYWHRLFGVDVVDEELLMFESSQCVHRNVMRLLGDKFMCLSCKECRDKPFGLNIL